jgi:hypothetical protein
MHHAQSFKYIPALLTSCYYFTFAIVFSCFYTIWVSTDLLWRYNLYAWLVHSRFLGLLFAHLSILVSKILALIVFITQDVPWYVCQTLDSYSLAYFECKMLYEYQHGSKSQLLCSCLMNHFPLSYCPCALHHPFRALSTLIFKLPCIKVSQFWISNELLPTKYSNLQQSAIYNSWFPDCSRVPAPTSAETVDLSVLYVHTHHLVGSLCSVIVEKMVICSSFGRRSSPGQIKHVVATWWYCTSYQSTSHTVLESVLRKLLNWSWRSVCLTTSFARSPPLDFYLLGYMKDLVYQEKSQTQDELL